MTKKSKLRRQKEAEAQKRFQMLGEFTAADGPFRDTKLRQMPLRYIRRVASGPGYDPQLQWAARQYISLHDKLNSRRV